MRRIQILLIAIALFAGQTFATGINKEKMRPVKRLEVISLDTTAVGYEAVYAFPDENLNDLFTEQIDSLVNSWYVQNTFNIDFNNEETDNSAIVSIPDSIYIQRLQAIDAYVDLSFNTTVKNFIELYTQRRREQSEIMLGLSSYYFPMIEELLDKYDLPMELKYMPVIESALNPRARSRANAVGLWQFMYGTGKMYKLEIGTFVDERRDPVKASEAAVKYLADLYKIYQNWHLVIAAYNCGPGNVNKAIRRSGGARDYWSIYYRLPRETRGYVPAFIAAAYLMNNYQEHNLKPRYPDFPIVTDTLTIRDYLHFKQIASVTGMSIEELETLNPQYRMDIIPAKPNKPYTLRLPIERVADFIDREEEIFAYERNTFFPNNEILVPKGNYYHPSEIQGKEKIYYTVKSGDNLGFISQRYHVSINDLRYWNNIHRNLIRVGQKLVIYVPKSGGRTAQSSSANISKDGQYVYYTVQRGDTLWSIAKLFPGISNQDIMRLNNIRDGRTLKPGQKLKIQPKS